MPLTFALAMNLPKILDYITNDKDCTSGDAGTLTAGLSVNFGSLL